MLHMSQNAFQYLLQPVTCTEMRLDTDSLYRTKCGSRLVYDDEQDKVCLFTPKKSYLQEEKTVQELCVFHPRTQFFNTSPYHKYRVYSSARGLFMIVEQKGVYCEGQD